MYRATKGIFAGALLMVCAVLAGPRPNAKTGVGAVQTPQFQALQRIDLAEQLAHGKLRTVNREVTKLQGSRDGVHVAEKTGTGLIWIEGSDFAEGTIELDVRGRDVFQQSFVGIAFHRNDDNTYDSVYLRPFNFHVDDPPAPPRRAVHRVSGLRLAAPSKGIPGGVRERG